MNIIFVYNLENKEFDELTFKIEESIKEIFFDKVVKISRKDKINSRLNPDVYVILSDDYDEVNKYYESSKIKGNCIVLTNNISSTNIRNMIKKTSYICYTKNDIETIVKKIYTVYLIHKGQYE